MLGHWMTIGQVKVNPVHHGVAKTVRTKIKHTTAFVETRDLNKDTSTSTLPTGLGTGKRKGSFVTKTNSVTAGIPGQKQGNGSFEVLAVVKGEAKTHDSVGKLGLLSWLPGCQRFSGFHGIEQRLVNLSPVVVVQCTTMRSEKTTMMTVTPALPDHKKSKPGRQDVCFTTSQIHDNMDTTDSKNIVKKSPIKGPASEDDARASYTTANIDGVYKSHECDERLSDKTNHVQVEPGVWKDQVKGCATSVSKSPDKRPKTSTKCIELPEQTVLEEEHTELTSETFGGVDCESFLRLNKKAKCKSQSYLERFMRSERLASKTTAKSMHENSLTTCNKDEVRCLREQPKMNYVGTRIEYFGSPKTEKDHADRKDDEKDKVSIIVPENISSLKAGNCSNLKKLSVLTICQEIAAPNCGVDVGEWSQHTNTEELYTAIDLGKRPTDTVNRTSEAQVPAESADLTKVRKHMLSTSIKGTSAMNLRVRSPVKYCPTHVNYNSSSRTNTVTMADSDSFLAASADSECRGKPVPTGEAVVPRDKKSFVKMRNPDSNQCQCTTKDQFTNTIYTGELNCTGPNTDVTKLKAKWTANLLDKPSTFDEVNDVKITNDCDIPDASINRTYTVPDMPYIEDSSVNRNHSDAMNDCGSCIQDTSVSRTNTISDMSCIHDSSVNRTFNDAMIDDCDASLQCASINQTYTLTNSLSQMATGAVGNTESPIRDNCNFEPLDDSEITENTNNTSALNYMNGCTVELGCIDGCTAELSYTDGYSAERNTLNIPAAMLTNPEGRISVDTEASTEMKESNTLTFTCGTVVWGRFSKMRWWPAIVIDASLVRRHERPGYLWLFWLSDRRLSQLKGTSVVSFNQRFRERTTGKISCSMRLGIQRAIEICAGRTDLTLDGIPDVVEWSLSDTGFVTLIEHVFNKDGCFPNQLQDNTEPRLPYSVMEDIRCLCEGRPSYEHRSEVKVTTCSTNESSLLQLCPDSIMETARRAIGVSCDGSHAEKTTMMTVTPALPDRKKSKPGRQDVCFTTSQFHDNMDTTDSKNIVKKSPIKRPASPQKTDPANLLPENTHPEKKKLRIRTDIDYFPKAKTKSLVNKGTKEPSMTNTGSQCYDQIKDANSCRKFESTSSVIEQSLEHKLLEKMLMSSRDRNLSCFARSAQELAADLVEQEFELDIDNIDIRSIHEDDARASYTTANIDSVFKSHECDERLSDKTNHVQVEPGVWKDQVKGCATSVSKSPDKRPKTTTKCIHLPEQTVIEEEHTELTSETFGGVDCESFLRLNKKAKAGNCSNLKKLSVLTICQESAAPNCGVDVGEWSQHTNSEELCTAIYLGKRPTDTVNRTSEAPVPAEIADLTKTFTCGTVVWGRFSKMRWWPAIVIDASLVRRHERPGYLWLFWLSDRRLSQLKGTSVESFNQRFRERTTGKISCSMRLGIQRAIEICAGRTDLTLDGIPDVVEWSLSDTGFVTLIEHVFNKDGCFPNQLQDNTEPRLPFSVMEDIKCLGEGRPSYEHRSEVKVTMCSTNESSLPQLCPDSIMETARRAIGVSCDGSHAGHQPCEGDKLNDASTGDGDTLEEWHNDITKEFRDNIVRKIAQAIFPIPDSVLSTSTDSRIKSLVSYSEKVESDIYDIANSKAEYDNLLVEKLFSVLTMLEQKRIERDGAMSGDVNGMMLPPSGSEKECFSCDFPTGGSTYNHPLFDGQICQHCRDALLISLYAKDDDGCMRFCAVCGHGGQLFICDQAACGKVFCVLCVEKHTTNEVVKKIGQQAVWYCFLCTPYNTATHGRVQPRPDWRIELVKFFQSQNIMLCQDLTYLTNPGKRKLRVLSLFDGIGSGKLALDELGFDVEAYYASEILEDAILVATYNHTMTQIGDTLDLTRAKLKELCPIDLVLGGPPCNDLSIVNPLRKGFNGTGMLLMKYVMIVKDMELLCRPTNHVFWLLENTGSMLAEFKETICTILGVKPAVWDAKHFTAQRRARNFWGNIPGLYSTPDWCRQLEQEKQDLDSALISNCNRKALVPQMRTITTGTNSLTVHNGEDQLPISMNGREDGIWIMELERLFGFPEHYTDVGHLSLSNRQKLIGKSWCVPVIKHLLAPLKPYFATRQE